MTSAQPASAVFAEAYRLHMAGRLAEAEQLYQTALAIDARHAESWHFLGLIALSRGRFDRAADLIAKAIAIKDTVANYHSHLGLALHHQGNVEAATASYARAVALNPDSAEALSNLGNAYLDQGRLADAERSYIRATTLKPDLVGAHSNLGLVLHKQGKLDEAASACRKALALRPDFPGAQVNLGNVLLAAGHFEEAAAAYRAGVVARNDDADAFCGLGTALLKLGRHDEAAAAYRKALDLRPDFAEAHNNLGILLAQEQPEAALALAERALARDARNPAYHITRGNSLRRLGRIAEAVEAYDQALVRQPTLAEALNNRGLAFQDLHRYSEARTSFDAAVAAAPSYADTHWNRSLLLLLLGSYKDGWREYEWRWKSPAMRHAMLDFGLPPWLGDGNLAGKTILIHAEQGLGDTLQFCRYVPLVTARGGRVVLRVQKPLLRLLSGLAGVSALLGPDDSLPAVEAHCPLLSLPHAFRTTVDTIPAAVPYLSADPALVSSWRAKLGSDHRPHVGLVWAGRRDHRNDHNRTLPAEDLAPLLAADVAFHCLQKDIDAKDRAWLTAHSSITFHDQGLGDFADTAGLIAALDLVITVDTAVAHLAGALAREAWVLLPYAPDFRWFTDRTDSPWYPTLRLFRQRAWGDWGSVIKELRVALQQRKRPSPPM